jgi:hypothetical protein
MHATVSKQSTRTIQFGFNAHNICPVDKATMKRLDSNMFVKVVNLGRPAVEITVADLEEAEDEAGVDNLGGGASRSSERGAQQLKALEGGSLQQYKKDCMEWACKEGLKENCPVVWESLGIYSWPFKLEVSELTIDDKDFPDSDSYICFQAYMTNWDEFTPLVKPKLVGYLPICVGDFLAMAGNWNNQNGMSWLYLRHLEFVYSGAYIEDKTTFRKIVQKEFKLDKKKHQLHFRRPPAKKSDPVFGNKIKAEKKAAENKAKWQVFKKKKEEDKGKAKDKSKSKRAAAKAEEEDNADNAEDGEEGKKKKSFFGGLFKKKEESSAEEVDVIKLTEKRLFQEKSSSESEKEEEEEASVVASGASGPAGPAVEPFVPTTGTLTIIDLYIVDTIVDVTDGDSRYDRLIAGIFGDVRDQWIRDTVCYFNEQSTYQAHRLFVACAVLNQTLKGCTLRPATVVDMTYACTQHLLTACSAHAAALNADHADDVADPGLSATKFFTPPSFDDSSVLRVLRVVYGSIGTLAPKNSMRVFAGGGVTAPPDEYLVESSGDGGNSRVSHWARGMLF